MARFFTLQRLTLFLKGMAMGGADSVPGISGGTIAFITGIYEELIHSIKSCNVHALKMLFREGPKATWSYINGNFLITLAAGIFTGLLLLLNAVLFLLENYEVYLMSFFIGLIVASALHIGRQIDAWHGKQILFLLLGVAVAVALGMLPRADQNISLIYVFLSAALAICAMILPGISGAFILVLLGTYEPVLNAVRAMDIVFIAVFLIGCVTGLISFANLLSWLFRHHRSRTLIFLLGVMMGSLYGIWPWRADNVIDAPAVFEPAFLGCMMAIIVGFLLVYLLEHINFSKQQLSID